MKVKLDKATFRDLKTQAQDMRLGYMSDFDENYLYFSDWVWSEEDDRSYDLTQRYSYTWSNGILTVDLPSKVTVIRQTEYQEIVSPLEKRLINIESMLSNFSGSKKEAEDDTPDNLIKQFDIDNMQIVEPLYIAGGETDGQRDAYKDPVEGPKQLVKTLQEAQEAETLQYSLFHKHRTKTFTIVKSWVNESEAVLEDGTTVPANQPMVITKFNNEKAYNARVEGRLTGLSIGALGTTEMVKTLQEQLGQEEKPARLLSGFILTHRNGHVAYTSPSQGGAASLKNEPFQIMKANNILDAEQKKLLDEFDEELTELDKSKLKPSDVDNKAPSTSAKAEAQDAGVDNKTVTKGQDTMSDDLKKEIEELKKQLATERLNKGLAKYSLKDEESSNLASALADLEEGRRDAVMKALDSVVAAGVSIVDELKAENEELSKSAEGSEKQEPTQLEKDLKKEDGKAEAAEHSEEEIAKARKVSNTASVKKELGIKS